MSEEAEHRRRLAKILRYIASIHLNETSSGVSFVQQAAADDDDFFQNHSAPVLFSTADFRTLAVAVDETSAPFSFFAARQEEGVGAKRTLAGKIKSRFSGAADKACWLRVTRLVAPKAPKSLFSSREEQLQKEKIYRQTLEPIYTRLFEWIQQQDHNEELVWGLGHAKLLVGGKLINGPLLEVLVEVELAQDGAILVRPRQHTGVSLNRQVVAALADTSSYSALQQIHLAVSELEATQLSPGQPSTYVPLLRRIAIELSPGGSFRWSKSHAEKKPSKLIVSEAWCLFSRSKPASVWARDANAFADQLMNPDMENVDLPLATWSITHGPGKLESIMKGDTENANTGGFLGWLFAQRQPAPSKPIRPIFPLPTSDAQSRIVDLLLTKNYPAVVCEGPPGTGKTQAIANLVCSYLSQGKRVLVTSKNGPALSVLRTRLPQSVAEHCVDVSMSENAGMRQLQMTVERLSNSVSSTSTEMEREKCDFLQVRIRS
jgi:hypothetical protein